MSIPEIANRLAVGRIAVYTLLETSEEIGAALRILGERDLVESEKANTGGRPVERWFATSEEARKARKERRPTKLCAKRSAGATRRIRRGGVMTYRAYRAPPAERKYHA